MNSRASRRFVCWCSAGLSLGIAVVACGGRSVLLGTTEAAGDYPGSGSGTGVTTGSSTSAVGSCATLQSCCPSLGVEEEVAACQEVVELGNDTECSELYAGLTSAGQCSVPLGTGSGSAESSACDALASCCSQVPPDDAAACSEILSTGNPNDCNAAFTAFSDENLCGGSTLPGSGTGIGTGSSFGGPCAALSACCPMTGAAMSACMIVVGTGVDDECSQELTVFEEDGLCGSSTGSGSGISSGSAVSCGGDGLDCCGALNACCGMLPSSELPSCLAFVMEGDEASCAAELSALDSAGVCEVIGG